MAVFPAELEGTLKAVETVSGNPNAVNLRVNGIAVAYSAGPGTSLRTPQGSITVEQLTRSAKLPGRSPDGFVGGTAIIEGDFDTSTNVVSARKITVEPGETLILGVVTRNESGPPLKLEVSGVPIEFLSDDRLKASAPRNEFGFDIKLDTVLRDMPASVNGYFSGGVFYAYLFEVDGPAKLTTDDPQVSILRAQSRNRGAEFDVDVRGAITTAHTGAGQFQRVDLYRVDDDPSQPGQKLESRIGGVQVRVIAGGFTNWRFDERVTAGPGILAAPPTLVRAYNRSLTPSPVSADFEVEVREG